MSKVNLLVSVDDEHLDRFSEVVKGLEDAGMDVEQELEGTGVVTGSIDSEKVELQHSGPRVPHGVVVTGSIDSEKVEQLRKVEGVSHVEESRQFQIAPPDSDIQ